MISETSEYFYCPQGRRHYRVGYGFSVPAPGRPPEMLQGFKVMTPTGTVWIAQ